MAEEKGYWFSTENGTHIHAEEGESKEQAMGKKFKSFKKGQSSLNFPKPTKEEHQETLDKEIKDSFKNREEGLRYLESQTNDWSDEEKESLKKRIDRVYPENKNDNPLKAESRSMINENQANDPRVLADKLDNQDSKEKVDSLYKDAKEENLSFERMLLNDIRNNPDSYNNIVLDNKEYKRVGNAFEFYEDGEYVSTGTVNSVASDINRYYENYKPQDLDQERSYGPEKYNTAEEALKAVDYYMGQDDEDSIDKFNDASEQLDMLLPFANDKEKEEWMNISATGTGEEIIDFAKSIIERANKNEK